MVFRTLSHTETFQLNHNTESAAVQARDRRTLHTLPGTSAPVSTKATNTHSAERDIIAKWWNPVCWRETERATVGLTFSLIAPLSQQRHSHTSAPDLHPKNWQNASKYSTLSQDTEKEGMKETKKQSRQTRNARKNKFKYRSMERMEIKGQPNEKARMSERNQEKEKANQNVQMTKKKIKN